MADRLLRHPVPYINESIGSYILRLCSENSCEVNQISALIGFYNMKAIENYYRKLKDKNITKISELTGLDIKVIEDMTANRFSFDEDNDYSCCTEACVCPKCYSERSYERIHWKNKLIKVCLDHEIYPTLLYSLMAYNIFYEVLPVALFSLRHPTTNIRSF